MTKELLPDYPVFEYKGDHTDMGEVIYDVMSHGEKILDRDGREYTHVGRYLEDDDFYQGLNMVSVIRRVSDGKLYGYSYWDGQRHGDDTYDANGDEFGLECDTDADDFDWDNDYVSYYVWQPVEEYPITAYKKVSDE